MDYKIFCRTNMRWKKKKNSYFHFHCCMITESVINMSTKIKLITINNHAIQPPWSVILHYHMVILLHIGLYIMVVGTLRSPKTTQWVDLILKIPSGGHWSMLAEVVSSNKASSSSWDILSFQLRPDDKGCSFTNPSHQYSSLVTSTISTSACQKELWLRLVGLFCRCGSLSNTGNGAGIHLSADMANLAIPRKGRKKGYRKCQTPGVLVKNNPLLFNNALSFSLQPSPFHCNALLFITTLSFSLILSPFQ